MKRFNQLCFFSLAAASMLGVSSCISDESVGVVNQLSYLSVNKTLAEEYKADRWDTLRIAAPEVHQSNTTKPLSYRWEINGKVVSTEKDLAYECKDYTKDKNNPFLCRLTISNEDGSYFKTFKLHVQYRYRTGVYVLANDNGKSIISYIRPDSAKSVVERDLLSKNNAEVTFSDAPTAATIIDYYGKNDIFFAAGSPSQIYRLDGNTMQLVSTAKAAGTVSYLYANKLGSLNNEQAGGKLTVIEDGDISDIKTSDLSLVVTSSTSRDVAIVLPNKNLAPAGFSWVDVGINNYTGLALYDNSKGFVVYAPDAKVSAKDNLQKTKFIYNEQFTGLQLLGMVPVNKNHNVALFLQDAAAGKYYHVWLYPGSYNERVKRQNSEPELKQAKIEVPASAGFNAKTKFVASQSTNLVYYSSGNKVYAYSVLSKGNFPTTPDFTCGEGEEVAAMVLNADESELIVATNSTTSKQGSVYSFNLHTNKENWRYQNVTGNVISLMFRK
jgi:putative lipoprotein